jgi:hypothetical protein
VAKKGKSGYQISLKGIEFTMPVEVKTSEGIQKVILGSKPVLVSSKTLPEVDPRGWLMLKK